MDPNKGRMLKTSFFPKIKKTAQRVDKIHAHEERVLKIECARAAKEPVLPFEMYGQVRSLFEQLYEELKMSVG